MPLQDRRDEALVRRAFLQFALLSGSLIVAVVVGVVALAEVQSDRGTIEDAESRGEVVAAAVHAGLADPDRDTASREFAETIEAVAGRSGVRAVLVWDETETVVWSTRSALVGDVYELDPAVLELFGKEELLVAESGERLDTARPSGLLGTEIEVYSPVEVLGQPLVVASYVDPATLGSTRSQTLQLLLPIGVGSLVLFQGLMLLAGAQLAKRVHASRRERLRLLTDSLSALDHERRRLAHDLHDGIVQDLAAMRYALSGLADSIPADLPDDPRRQLHRVCAVLEEELTQLRGMLGELLPVEQEQLPLPQTLQALMARLVPDELRWSVEVDPKLDMVDPTTTELTQRVVQEAVRNAVRHARPHLVVVRVSAGEETSEPRVRVEVDDDGDGITFGPHGQSALTQRDHLGLRLLRDLVRDLDGELTLSARAEGGTRLSAEWSRSTAPSSPLGTRS